MIRPATRLAWDFVEASVASADTQELKKARGAYFTPEPIAEYLADWAVEGDPEATVLDPTCGEAVFLQAAAERLHEIGASVSDLRRQVLGVDLHPGSVHEAQRTLRNSGLDGTFLVEDFFAHSTPDRLDAQLPFVDAVIGNPPYVRYQEHRGDTRKRAQHAALAQGVRLSGLSSSWAALLVHACGFLKPEGRLAMVLPAELLSVGYAEPVRRWLKRRFKAVHLVMFEQLQFEDALERVVLVLARGTGGTKAFTLVPVDDAHDLPGIRMFGPMHLNVAPADDGKWTDFLLPVEQRQLFDEVVGKHFVQLSDYGPPGLGTVTGNNEFFCLTEQTRRDYEISQRHVMAISPPGTRHLQGLSLTNRDWEILRDAGEPVWLLQPNGDEEEGLRRYLARGRRRKVHEAYKCRIRDPWFLPPAVSPPDLFFTYMSHRYPRVIANTAGVGIVNSMHGIRLREGAPRLAVHALPLLMLNSVTMMGAEVFGRSYGGGVLKMEPSEASALPVPSPGVLEAAWKRLRADRLKLDRQLRNGLWAAVVKRVDEALLAGAAGISDGSVRQLFEAARTLREHRIGRESTDGVE